MGEGVNCEGLLVVVFARFSFALLWFLLSVVFFHFVWSVFLFCCVVLCGVLICFVLLCLTMCDHVLYVLYFKMEKSE